MKNTVIKTDEMKKGNFFIKREIFLAITFFILALLLFAGLSTMAQTPETFNVIRYGKEVTLAKDRWMTITDFSVVSDNSATYLKWKTKTIYGKGVYAVMRSEDGINYAYAFLLIAVKRENSFVVQNDCENKQSYYRVLYISDRNTFCLSETENSLGFVKETTTQQQ